MDNASKPRASNLTNALNLQAKPVDSCEENMEETANDFSTHPDFAEAQKDGLLWDSTSLDGLNQLPL